MNYLVNFQPLQLAFSGQFSTGVNKEAEDSDYQQELKEWEETLSDGL